MKTIYSLLFASLLLISLILSTACSSVQPIPKNKWTDKNMRVMIDPDSIDESNYVQIQSALVRTGKFTVVDRGAALRAVKKEQERLHRQEEDRFEDKEKWAHWGKLYGVGSVIIAHTQCIKDSYIWSSFAPRMLCKQFLSMVDANTGLVFLAVESENTSRLEGSYQLSYVAPDWNEAVTKLVNDYPRFFEEENYRGPAAVYQDVSEEHAKRQRERKGE